MPTSKKKLSSCYSDYNINKVNTTNSKAVHSTQSLLNLFLPSLLIPLTPSLVSLPSSSSFYQLISPEHLSPLTSLIPTHILSSLLPFPLLPTHSLLSLSSPLHPFPSHHHLNSNVLPCTCLSPTPEILAQTYRQADR